MRVQIYSVYINLDNSYNYISDINIIFVKLVLFKNEFKYENQTGVSHICRHENFLIMKFRLVKNITKKLICPVIRITKI